jgi:GH15 family glucan-1,4-alpha-glucosidase
VRGPRRHFVHSKIMAWVGFDRAVAATELGLPGPADRWRQLRDQIHREVLEQGYDRDRGAFTQYYGSGTLDAAVLLMGELGFLPPDDPRLVSTVDTISRELMTGGLVRRYELSTDGTSAVDGLPGSEGAFLACSFWLANALHMIGRQDDAVELFERLLGLRSDLGILSEEYDPRYGRLVGNTPQAFSHVPLIQTALNLDDHGHHSRRPGGRLRRTGLGPGPA